MSIGFPSSTLFAGEVAIAPALSVGDTWLLTAFVQGTGPCRHLSPVAAQPPTLHDLAAEFGVSAERIGQVEVKAMQKMRPRLAPLAPLRSP